MITPDATFWEAESYTLGHLCEVIRETEYVSHWNGTLKTSFWIGALYQEPLAHCKSSISNRYFDLFILYLKLVTVYNNKSSNTKKYTLNMRTIIKLKKNDVSCVPKRHTNLYQLYIIYGLISGYRPSGLISESIF